MAIKLFGKTIQMPSAREVLVMNIDDSSEEDDKAASSMDNNNERKYRNEEAPNSLEQENDERNDSATNEEDSNTDDLSAEKKSKTDEQQNKESNSSMDKSLKKPDKILPCPRCRSMDTKFCYYNNYNVNQPRYFCKNCQRYWTAGGSIRNVPIGAGRRRSKSYLNHQRRNIRAQENIEDNLLESVNHSGPVKSTGTLLSFRPDGHLCQSMYSVVDVKQMKEDARSTRPLTTDLNSNNEISKTANINSYTNPPCLNTTHWPNPLSHTPDFSIPFNAVNGYWCMSWLLPHSLISPITGSPGSTILGKHTREGNMLNNSNSDRLDSTKPEKSLWIPKTLRIDDTKGAAKCSILATQGIKKHKVDSFNNAELTYAFTKDASQILCANPAALSRSLGFHERL